MQYRLVTPDITVHDENTCPGKPHCKVDSDRSAWNAAYPLWRMATTEIGAVRAVRERFPDAFPMPIETHFPGEPEGIMVIMFESEEDVRRMQVTRRGVNPVCIVELVPETREDRKRIKKGGALTKHTWFEGWVPELDTILLERQLTLRSSLRVGPTDLDAKIGIRNGKFELQIPGAISIVLPAELCEQIGKLQRP